MDEVRRERLREVIRNSGLARRQDEPVEPVDVEPSASPEARPALYRGAAGQIAAARSRLEVRWMVWMDAMGIPWEYEPAFYRIHGRGYIPDFRLPDQGCWMEVKPAGHEADPLRYQGMADLHQAPLLLIAGPPALGEYRITLFRAGLPPEPGLCWACGRRDHGELWLASLERGVALPLSAHSRRSDWPTPFAYVLREAYRQAMSWHFEGEQR